MTLAPRCRLLPIRLLRSQPSRAAHTTPQPTNVAAQEPPGKDVAKQPIHLVARCPEPTCACAPTPPDLDLDRMTSMQDSVPIYNKHAMLLTGHSDWPANMDEDPVAVTLKQRMQLHSNRMFDPHSRPLVSYTSLTPPTYRNATSDPLLHPLPKTFDYFFLKDTHYTILRYPRLRYAHLRFSHGEQKLYISPERSHIKTELLILICGHARRDARCGTLGVLLEAEFKKALERKGIRCSASPDVVVDHGSQHKGPKAKAEAEAEGGSSRKRQATVNVGLMSCVSGAQWVGNVLVYSPPGFRLPGTDTHSPLNGKGIWYGRVEPRHVEGLVEETVMKGNVVRELLRGGIDSSGTMMDVGPNLPEEGGEGAQQPVTLRRRVHGAGHIRPGPVRYSGLATDVEGRQWRLKRLRLAAEKAKRGADGAEVDGNTVQMQ